MRCSPPVLRALLPVLIVSMISAGMSCSTKTRISSQWKSPDYKGGPMHKILVVGISETSLGRRTYEDRFAKALRDNGADAVASYTLLPTDDRLTREELEGTVQRDGFDGVIVTQLLEVAKETTYVPPSSHVVPSSYRYGYYGHYGTRYDVVHTPGYTRTSEIVRLETQLWNAEDSQLAWGITSETFDPTSTDDAITSVTNKLVSKLSEDGLIAK